MSTYPHRMAGIARGVGALVLLVVLLVGVPGALVGVVGWPGPTVLPRVDQLRLAFDTGIPDLFWLKAFAAVVWVAWLQVALAIGLELAALVRGRCARPRVGLGWAQHLVTRLVGAVVLASSLVGHVPSASAAPIMPLMTVAVPASAALPTDPAPASPLAAPRADASSTTHVVVRGETLSSIAEDELGQQAAWPAIWTANQGRAFGSRVFRDPDLILPGWDLVVPPMADPAELPAEPEPGPGPSPSPVDAVVLIPPVVISAPASVAQALPSTDAVPTTAAPTTAVPTSAVPTSAVPSASGRAGSAPAIPMPGPADDGIPAWAGLGALAGATLLATGAAGMLASARRRALRRAGPHATVEAPPAEVAAAITAVSGGSDALAMARLELALRALAGRLGRDGVAARPLAVRTRAGAIEVQLDQPAEVGAPWTAGADRLAWTLPATVALHELIPDARAVAPPCPALVELGRKGGTAVYVDLEAVGALDVGTGEPAASAVRMMAATMATTPLADGLRVIVVGDDGPQLRGGHEVEVVPDLGAALQMADAATAPIARVTAGAPSTFRLRAIAGHESWEPVVVLLAAPPPPEELPALLALARSHRGVAVVGSGLGVEWRLEGGDEPDRGHRLEPLGWPVALHGLSPRALDVLDAVLASGEGAVVDAPVPAVAREDVSTQDRAPRDWSLMVRILGPVDVVDGAGRPAAFERAKALELVVWLAQHPGAATRSGARSALWELDVSNASFSNVVSEARRSLARLLAPPEGEEWLARTYADRLPLHPAVVLDAHLVADHLVRARAQADDDPGALAELRQALELVRGAPYAGVSYLWPDAEALPSTLTLLVTSVAGELGRRLLAQGDTDGTFAATAVGLEVLPGHEELVALRLRAHALRGDWSALRHEYAGYEHAVLADPWGGDPSPALAALRQELLGTPVPVGGE